MLDTPLFSPRTSLLFKPSAPHIIRLSFNRAYRAPSLVNNFLDTTIVNQLDLGALNPHLAGRVYNLPVAAVGNPSLGEESLNAYAVGCSGVLAGVPDSRFHGTTEAYTLVNGTVGYTWNDTFTTSLRILNLLDDEIQQHVFGDVMRRQVMLELRMRAAARP